LRREAQVPHHRNARREDTRYGFGNFLPALQFHGMSAGFFHNADGGFERHSRVALIRTERQVHHYQRALDGPHHRGGVVDHLVECDGQGGFVARHDIGGGVAYQQDVGAGFVEDARHGVVVGGEHGNFFAARLHGLQDVGRHPFDFFVYGHGLFRMFGEAAKVVKTIE